MSLRIEEQLERLCRRYSVARSQLDDIEILDVAHCLRVWIEISKDKDCGRYVSLCKKFKCASPSKGASRALKKEKADYLWLFMGNELYAEILVPEVFMPDDVNLPRQGQSRSCYSNFRIDGTTGVIHMRDYYYGHKIEGVKGKNTNIKRNLSLRQFFTSQILRYHHNGDLHAYSVEMLVSRISNGILDASHFQKLETGIEAGELTRALPTIAAVKVGGISLLYFFLLYVAQEILFSFGKVTRLGSIKE